MADGLYDTDILAWSETQADLLARIARGQRVNGVDWGNVVEEIADVGLSELNAVISFLRQGMLHLIKMHISPDSLALDHWRDEIGTFLDDADQRFAPSMRQRIDMDDIWRRAITRARKTQAGNPNVTTLPAGCPWTLDDLLAGDADALLAALSLTNPASQP